MIKIIPIIICLALTAGKGFTQSPKVDSLEKELYKHPQKDTMQLAILNDLAYYYRVTDPDRGLQTADKAIHLARLLNDPAGLSSAYNNKAVNYDAMGNDSMAIKYYLQNLALKKKLEDPKGIAVALHNLGISYFNLSDYNKALNNQQQAYTLFDSLSHQNGMAATLNSIGVIYLYLSDYPRALRYYLKALRIYEKNKDEYNKGAAFVNIGLVYNHLGQFDKALDYQFKALNIFKRSGDHYNMQNSLGNIGNTYDQSGKPDKALGFYQQALLINKELNNKRGIASNLINSGIVYLGKENYEKAFHHLQDALILYQQLSDKHGMSSALSFLSKVYFKAGNPALLQMGIQPSQRFYKTIVLQQKGLKLAQEIGNLEVQCNSWNNLHEIYLAKGAFPEALNAFKQYITIRDSMLNEKKRAEITRISMQYEFDKEQAVARAEQSREKELAAAKLEKQKMVKNIITGGAGTLLLAGFISFFFYKKKRDAEELKKEAELRVEVADTEMKALRAQMNPHFIFNSLNSISDYINKHDTQTADHYLTKFAHLMRMTLENSEQKEIPLAEDLKALALYLQMEALRLNHKFTYEIQVAGNIDQDITLVPPLMLQPFVENSIWHGIANKNGKGKILIEIKKEEEMINCIVEDNGIGAVKRNAATYPKKSLGMKITRSRMDMINKLKKANASLQYSNLAEGMRVELKLPLSLSF